MEYLSFKLEEILYIVDITQIQEIIELKSVEVSSIPNAPSFVEGVINLRGKIIPIVDLAKRMNVKTQRRDSGKILILKTSGAPTGLIVDTIEKVIRLTDIEIEDIPEIAATSSNIEFLKGVIRKDDKILMLLDLEKVLSKEEKKLLDIEMKEEVKLQIKEEQKIQDLQLIGFVISGIAHAIEMERIQEIIKIPQITQLPSSPHFIKGVINMRGEVVVVIDIRQFLGLPYLETTKESRIFIIKSDGKVCGIEVDKILQVIKINQDIIQPPLSTLEPQSHEFIKGEFLHSETLFVLLDLDKILSSKEIKKWQ